MAAIFVKYRGCSTYKLLYLVRLLTAGGNDCETELLNH